MPPGPLQSIVVGFDGSPASGRAAAFAMEIARQGKARLFLVHAREAFPERAEPTTEEEATSAEDAVAAAVASWCSRAASEGVALVPVTRPDAPAAAILGVAREVEAGLIVVGTRGLRPIVRAVIGSVSSEVLEKAHVPVTVVP